MQRPNIFGTEVLELVVGQNNLKRVLKKKINQNRCSRTRDVPKPGAYITHHATRLQSVLSEICVCYASSG